MFGGCGDFDEAGLKVSPVSFVEGIIATADEECPVPPFLLAVVLIESIGKVLGSSNIAADILDCIGVFTKQEIDAVAVSLFPGE